MTGPRSVLARQRRDHAEIDRLMGRYRARRDDEDGERILKELVQPVFSHAFAEETVPWPVVRRFVPFLPGGEELTARVEEDLLLPRLQDAMDTAGLRRLGTAWETVRRTAPTPPRPAVRRCPPGNGVPASR